MSEKDPVRLSVQPQNRKESDVGTSDTFTPSRGQANAVKSLIMLSLRHEDRTLSDLAGQFQNGLKPSDDEVAEQFGALVAGMQKANLIRLQENPFEKGVVSYELTAEGLSIVNDVVSGSEHNRIASEK